MNRYILFAFEFYYPSGGINDAIGFYANFDLAKLNAELKMRDFIKSFGPTWFYWSEVKIFDTMTGESFDLSEKAMHEYETKNGIVRR